MKKKIVFEVDQIVGQNETAQLRDELTRRVTQQLVPGVVGELLRSAQLRATAFRFLGRVRYETEYVVLTAEELGEIDLLLTQINGVPGYNHHVVTNAVSKIRRIAEG